MDADPGKAGFAPAVVAEGLPGLLALANLEVRGLMTIGQFTATPDEARMTFRRLRELATRLSRPTRAWGPSCRWG